jgi:hypothetical protein
MYKANLTRLIELDFFVAEITECTNANDHTGAIIYGVILLGMPDQYSEMVRINGQQQKNDYLINADSEKRNKIYNEMMEKAKKLLNEKQFEKFYGAY